MSKRKHHNAHKRLQRFLSDVRLWTWESEGEGEKRPLRGVIFAGMVQKSLSLKQAESILVKTNNWIVCCRALCVSGNDTWIESEIRAARQVKIADFEEIYKQMRQQVFESVQRRHVIDCGWIVQTYQDNKKIDDEGLVMFGLGKTSAQRQANWQRFEAVDNAA